MNAAEVKRLGSTAYREALPADWTGSGPAALLVHGYPASSYMWHETLPALAACGYRAVAPDLAGFGDSAPEQPATWEGHVDRLERFRAELGLQRVALIGHDWGTLIGLRWACEHPDAVGALVIANGGFFPDGRWHGLAKLLRTPGEGEQLLDSFTREGFDGMLRAACPAISPAALEQYWKAFADEPRRRAQLELYRSGDFEKLAPYDGKLAQLGVPTLILWGATDGFAPVAGGYRFKREIAHAALVIFDDAGHFVFEEEPAAARAVADFLGAQVAR